MRQPFRFLLVALSAAILVGCGPRERVAPSTVGKAWQEQQQTESPAKPASQEPALRTATGPTGEGQARDTISREPPIATVDGQPIARRRVVDLLLRSHGVGVLEQLIVLDAAERLATDKGLSITRADLDREYDHALRQLTDPLATVTPESFDRAAAERVLENVLARRNISREEFLTGVRRNALLRRIVESEQAFTDEQLRQEYDRRYGRRVRIRHIQLATPAEVGRVEDRLATGDAFDELARRFSANEASARRGGLLKPFSARDEDLPRLLRDVAFGLAPGEVSSAARVGDWYHLIKLVEALPAENVDFPQVRTELEQRLRDRLTGPAMRALYERLFQEATIRIHDPVLQQAFGEKHPDRG